MESFLSSSTYTDWEKCLEPNDLPSEITFCKVSYATYYLTVDKYPGDDGTPSEFFKDAKEVVIPRLTVLFNQTLIIGNFHTTQKTQIALDESHYLTPRLRYLLTYKTLDTFIEKKDIIGEYQGWFRKKTIPRQTT